MPAAGGGRASLRGRRAWWVRVRVRVTVTVTVTVRVRVRVVSLSPLA